MSVTSIMMRYQFGKGDKKRDAGLTTPKDIVRYDNLPYGKCKKWNLLDVYRPKSAQGKLPVIISVHGGGWVYGTKEVYQFYCMSLAQRGFAVVNFNYRLAPENKYPAQMEDVNQAVCWVLERAEEFEFDTENIFMVGDSAGGHLLSLYASMCSNPEYAAKYEFKTPENFVPRAVALNCGVYDIVQSIQWQDRDKLMKDLLGRRYTMEQAESVSPVLYITEKFPPAYVMTATGDFLKEQPKNLLAQFDRLHVPYEYKVYGTEENLLPHVFHCDMRSEDAALCNDEECAFFRTHMKKETL